MMSATEDNDITSAYIKKYGSTPKYVTCSSGRVVMMGDHIDYNNFGILAFCIDRDIKTAIGFGPSEGDFMCLSNENKEEFADHVFHSVSDVCVQDTHVWYNYVSAGFIGLCEYIISDYDINQVGKLYYTLKNTPLWTQKVSQIFNKNITLFINGNIPIGSGISSSSSLVVSTLVAILLITDIKLTKNQIAELSALAEQHVGTRGGGMDQACICFCEENFAQYITFNPLTHRLTPLPIYVSIFLCHLLIQEHKNLTRAIHFNKRVFECKIGAILLLKALFPDFVFDDNEVQSYHYQLVQEKTGLSFEELLDEVELQFKSTPYNKNEIEQLIGSELLKKCLAYIGFDVWEKNSDFEVQKRAKHVYTEAWRVKKYLNICYQSQNHQTKNIEGISQIINESYFSEANYYECSCPQADEILQFAAPLNVIGARLVGAGWGGFMAFAVKPDQADHFKTHMTKYYMNKNIATDQIHKQYLFQVSPYKGLRNYQINQNTFSPIDFN